jgi:TPR repeat protein
MKKNGDMTIKYYEKACDQDFVISCRNLGLIHKNGQVKKDLKYGRFFREVLLSEIHCFKIVLTSPHLSVRFFRFQISTQIFYLNFIQLNTCIIDL